MADRPTHDDHEAVLARIEELERENARLRDENARLRLERDRRANKRKAE